MSTSNKIIHVLGNNFPSYLNSLVNVVGAIFMYVCWTKLIMKAQFHWIPFHTKLSPHVWIQCEFCAMYELVCLTCQQFPVNCKAGDANHTNTQRSNPKHSTKLFVDKQWGIIIQRRGNSSTVKMESSTSPHLHFIYSPQKNAFHAPPQAKLLLPHNLQTTYTILPAETQAKKKETK